MFHCSPDTIDTDRAHLAFRYGPKEVSDQQCIGVSDRTEALEEIPPLENGVAPCAEWFLNLNDAVMNSFNSLHLD